MFIRVFCIIEQNNSSVLIPRTLNVFSLYWSFSIRPVQQVHGIVFRNIWSVSSRYTHYCTFAYFRPLKIIHLMKFLIPDNY